MPYVKKLHTLHCPACRAPRPTRIVGTATVTGQPMSLAQCQADGCALTWAVRTTTLPAPDQEGTP
ncbi:hypothetical protein ABZ517_30165 [Streptomyces scabiei]|uniref:hypothetical protein n=1 Tax=Streptomyces scabiei TaxID=1930 RepID=UPI0033D43579